MSTVYVMKIVMAGVTCVLLSSLNGRGFEFRTYDIVHESNKMSFG